MRASVADITSAHIAIDASENSIFTRATSMFHLFYTRNDESRSETLREIDLSEIYDLCGETWLLLEGSNVESC